MKMDASTTKLVQIINAYFVITSGHCKFGYGAFVMQLRCMPWNFTMELIYQHGNNKNTHKNEKNNKTQVLQQQQQKFVHSTRMFVSTMCLLSKSNLFVTTLVVVPCLTIVISICNHICNYILTNPNFNHTCNYNF
jgi:hypothetical protein